MFRRNGKVRLALLAVALLVVGYGVHFLWGWYGPGPLDKDIAFIVPEGSGLASVARGLEAQGAVASAETFRARVRLLGSTAGIKAGEFTIPAHANAARILAILQGAEGEIRRLVNVPEGMPSILVYERLMAQPMLTGKIAVPAEGSILPESYDFQRGQTRVDLVIRMQKAMTRTIADLWSKRTPRCVARTPEEALILASIVEKETGKPSERRMVAGLYGNRLRAHMPLQADPTIIYPITQGKPLGRRIRESEIHAVNDYNTYAMIGLPKGPITNPGRASIAAVMDPADTDALYMVADGTGGHVFAHTLQEHNANVSKWFAIRRARGDL